jgi:hypothetical protein
MNNRDCKHGQLARSCEICELEGELAEVKQWKDISIHQGLRIKSMEAELTDLRKKAKGIENFYNRWRHLGVDTNADILWQAIKNFVEEKCWEDAAKLDYASKEVRELREHDEQVAIDHQNRHKSLHKCLDELLADFIQNNRNETVYLSMPLIRLLEWSAKQANKVDH